MNPVDVLSADAAVRLLPGPTDCPKTEGRSRTGRQGKRAARAGHWCLVWRGHREGRRMHPLDRSKRSIPWSTASIQPVLTAPGFRNCFCGPWARTVAARPRPVPSPGREGADRAGPQDIRAAGGV